MTAPSNRLAPRVEALEQAVEDLADRQDKLERIAERLRHDQAETRRQIKSLRDTVAGIPEAVQTRLDAQTAELKVVIAQSETSNADRITSLARQWPAGAIILATLLGGALVGLAVDAILAAFHQPHLG